MEEQLISFETAQLAKTKGFNWDCQNSYDKNGEIDNSVDLNGELVFTQESFLSAEENGYSVYAAPTQSLLQKWLRDVHNIEINISQNINKHVEYFYFPSLITLAPNKLSLLEAEIEGTYFKYEEALEKGLTEALKYIS